MKHSASVRVNNYTLTAKYPGLKEGLKIEKSSKKPVKSRKIEDYIIEVRSQSRPSRSAVQQALIIRLLHTQRHRSCERCLFAALLPHFSIYAKVPSISTSAAARSGGCSNNSQYDMAKAPRVMDFPGSRGFWGSVSYFSFFLKMKNLLKT